MKVFMSCAAVLLRLTLRRPDAISGSSVSADSHPSNVSCTKEQAHLGVLAGPIRMLRSRSYERPTCTGVHRKGHSRGVPAEQVSRWCPKTLFRSPPAILLRTGNANGRLPCVGRPSSRTFPGGAIDLGQFL